MRANKRVEPDSLRRRSPQSQLHLLLTRSVETAPDPPRCINASLFSREMMLNSEIAR